MRYVFFEETSRVSNSEELANAFTREEWARIIYYYVQQNNIRGGAAASVGSFGDNPQRVRRYMDVAQRNIGADMSRMTPSSYMRRATRYGIRFPYEGIPSWSQIHTYLARGLEQRTPPAGWDSDVPGGPNQRDNTPEQNVGWIETNSTEWSDAEQLKSEYIRPWLVELMRRRGDDFRNWYMGTNAANQNDNYWKQQFEKMLDQWEQTIAGGGSVTKADVDQDLWNWVRQADMSFARYTPAEPPEEN